MVIKIMLAIGLIALVVSLKTTPSPVTPFEAPLIKRDVVTVIPNTMVWPFPESTISSTFGDRPDLYWLGHHDGLDFGVDYNLPIPAITEGTVIYAQWRYGLEVRIQNGQYTYLYAHLNRIDVVVGQYVQMGEPIGLVGSTGYSTGPHLHLEIWDNGVPIDPYPILKDRGKTKYIPR
jgi:murein DD-endopeptidase MepM/ murein hydrolase activator NlpD